MERLENVPETWSNEAQELLGANVLKPAVCRCESCQTTLALFGEQVTASCFQLAWKDYPKASQDSQSLSSVFQRKQARRKQAHGAMKHQHQNSRSQGAGQSYLEGLAKPLTGHLCFLRWLSWLPGALGMLSWCNSSPFNAAKNDQGTASLWARKHLLLHHCPGLPRQNGQAKKHLSHSLPHPHRKELGL